jgi:nucleoid-associated protein YgaU
MQLTIAGRLTAVVAAVVVCAAAPAAADAPAAVVGEDFPAAAIAAVQLAALAASAWTLLVLGAGALTGRHLPGLPRAWRAALFTTALVTVVAAPAHADRAHDLDGLTLPDRPIAAAAPPAAPVAAETVTVRTGDTLWDLAAARLRGDPSPADVARSCARWHAANRQVIGADPDLIHPGQVLSPPTPEQDAS